MVPVNGAVLQPRPAAAGPPGSPASGRCCHGACPRALHAVSPSYGTPSRSRSPARAMRPRVFYGMPLGAATRRLMAPGISGGTQGARRPGAGVVLLALCPCRDTGGLSQMIENRKVAMRKSLTFRHTVVTCGRNKATLRQHAHAPRSTTTHETEFRGLCSSRTDMLCTTYPFHCYTDPVNTASSPPLSIRLRRRPESSDAPHFGHGDVERRYELC